MGPVLAQRVKRIGWKDGSRSGCPWARRCPGRSHPRRRCRTDRGRRSCFFTRFRKDQMLASNLLSLANTDAGCKILGFSRRSQRDGEASHLPKMQSELPCPPSTPTDPMNSPEISPTVTGHVRSTRLGKTCPLTVQMFLQTS